MLFDADLNTPLVSSDDDNERCPVCNGVTHRIRRRPIDKLINIFYPIYRYRCGSLGCHWQGNLFADEDPDPPQK